MSEAQQQAAYYAAQAAAAKAVAEQNAREQAATAPKPVIITPTAPVISASQDYIEQSRTTKYVPPTPTTVIVQPTAAEIKTAQATQQTTIAAITESAPTLAPVTQPSERMQEIISQSAPQPTYTVETSTDTGPDIIVGTPKTGQTAPIVIQPGYSASNLGQAQSNVITLEAQTLIANAQNSDVVTQADAILNKPINVDAYENPEKYNWSETPGGYKGFKKQYEETVKIKEKALANIAKNSAAMNKYNAEVVAYAAALAVNQKTFSDWVVSYNKWLNDSNRVERQAELLSQSTKWIVDGVTYDTYKEAEAAAVTSSSPTITKQELITNRPDYFVDAPGMEDYVASLNIPTTQSGIRQQGWLDANIDAAAASLHRFGRFEEQAAQDQKLAGDNLGAGLRASAAIALGASSAVFDAGSWMLNPYPTDAVNMITEFEKNPLFDTGYVGGNVALILYGAGELYGAAGRRMPKVIKDWASKPDDFIDIAHESLGQPKLTGLPDEIDAEYWAKKPVKVGEEGINPFEDVPYEWWKGSVERKAALQYKSTPTAYAMVELQEPLTTLSSNLRTAAATPYYALDYPVYSYRGATAGVSVAGLISALGAASAAKSLLAENQRTITALAPALRTPSIVATLTLPTQTHVQIPTLDTISITSQIQDPLVVTGQVPILDTPTITETITTPLTITEQTPIQVTESDMDVPPFPPPPPPHPPTPDTEPPPKTPKVLPLKGSKLTKREDERRRRELRGGDYVVTLRYGRRTVTKTVDAKSFREALTKTITGHPSEVEVRRRG